MRVILSFLAATLLATVLQAQPEQGIAVIVNDSIITYYDVHNSVAPALEVLERQYRSQPAELDKRIKTLLRESVQALVEQKLVLAEFSRAGYNLPESIIEDEVQKRIRDSYSDRLTLTKTLQAQGITYESFRKRIREEFIVMAMRQKYVSQELIISPHKVEVYYQQHEADFKVDDQIKLRMIVMNKPKEGADTAKEVAQEVLRKLETGAPFAEMAGIYSDAAQRTPGGDWGWRDRTALRKELADVAFTLNPGQRSGVIETSEAYWILLVEEKNVARTKPLSEVRDEIEKTLVIQERARLQQQWISRLKEKSFVRYF
jgi:peptidyl-prolyl cis-trans isomerase SurA